MNAAKEEFRADLCVVGGAGHVGLPLAIVFASKGLRVMIHDVNAAAWETIRAGKMPFMEAGAEPLLKDILAKGRLAFSSDPSALQGVPKVIITIGTPLDEYFNPVFKGFQQFLDASAPHMDQTRLIVLRSTVAPGTTEWLQRELLRRGLKAQLAFCPERIVQGFAVQELQELPQIVSGTTDQAAREAAELFRLITREVIHVSPVEAEFAKIFCNVYRYVQFAIANQFYMVADAAGVDYSHILEACKHHYPRLQDMPGAGFAAGPCLLKDTMTLVAFARNQFSLGHAAMMVNEGLVLYLVEKMAKEYDLPNMTVGLLGMAFKGESDDTRASLSYKLKKFLTIRARRVLTADPYVTTDPDIMPVERVIGDSDLLVLCTPHRQYAKIDLGGKPFIDVWGCHRDEGKGSRQSRREA
jgi:UDP-N-acetyl-D-mannosaminuronic acid dehydrogenase